MLLLFPALGCTCIIIVIIKVLLIKKVFVKNFGKFLCEVPYIYEIRPLKVSTKKGSARKS